MSSSLRANHQVVAYALLVVSALTVQTVILHFSVFEMMFVDLGLIVVIWTGLVRGARSGMTVGFITGLLEDCLSGCALGTNALVKTLIGLFSGLLGLRVLPNSPVAHLLSLFTCSVLNYILLYVLQMTVSPASINAGRFAMLMIAGVLSTTVLGMIIFRALSTNRFFKPPRVPDDMIDQGSASAD